VINIVFQSIFTLLWQIGAAIFVGWIFVRFANAPPWIYVPLIIVGVVSGFVSMVRFILAAMRSLDRIEEQRKAKNKKMNSEENKNEQ
jgi:F0F1-type ATP synthase assembly protein I